MQAQIVRIPAHRRGTPGQETGLDVGTSARIGQTLYVEFGVVGIVVARVQVFLYIAQHIAKTLEVYDFALAQELDRVAHIGVIDQAEQVVVSCARFLLWCMVTDTTLYSRGCRLCFGVTLQPPDGIGTGCLKGPAVCADVGQRQTHERVSDLLPAQVGMNIGVIDVYNLIAAKGEGDFGHQFSLRRACKNPIGFMGVIHVKQLLSGKKVGELFGI